jgi:hypothetical protein
MNQPGGHKNLLGHVERERVLPLAPRVARRNPLRRDLLRHRRARMRLRVQKAAQPHARCCDQPRVERRRQIRRQRRLRLRRVQRARARAMQAGREPCQVLVAVRRVPDI